jgi:hypothetical protein
MVSSNINEKNSPIIFCHFGSSEYLPFVFQMAAEKNPEKDIFLLGDASNKYLADKYNIKHRFFSDYSKGVEIELFDSVYKLVKGNRHRHIRNGVDWVNFVFKRWFYVYNFIKEEEIKSFWHFDSDNLILDSLARHEIKFSKFDCTEQCEGACMNGFIANNAVVLGYINQINRLFQDDIYLKKMQEDFDSNDPSFAFTEMAAYGQFKKCCHPATVALSSIIAGESFDDCLCHEHNMTMEYYPPLGRKIKKINFESGSAYASLGGGGQRVRMVTLNMSWLPLDFYKAVVEHTSNECRIPEALDCNATLVGICISRYNKNYFYNKYMEYIKKIKKIKKILKRKRKKFSAMLR